MAGADQFDVVLLTDAEHRFGGAENIGEVHVFTYAAFEYWAKTMHEQASIQAVCGALFRPSYMGKMAIDQPMCPECSKQCWHYGKNIDPIQMD
jgi:hypothetical protein